MISPLDFAGEQIKGIALPSNFRARYELYGRVYVRWRQTPGSHDVEDWNVRERSVFGHQVCPAGNRSARRHPGQTSCLTLNAPTPDPDAVCTGTDVAELVNHMRLRQLRSHFETGGSRSFPATAERRNMRSQCLNYRHRAGVQLQ